MGYWITILMKTLNGHILLFLGLVAFGLAITPSQNANLDDIAVIVSNKVIQSELTKDELLNIYTLRTRNWENGSRIVVSDYKGTSELRSQFYVYLGTQINTIKKVWLKAQFTGKITPPRTVDSVENMNALILENPGTIGYVPLSQVPDEATVLLVISHD